MARRPIPEEDDITLFPFLSVIAAVIGVLTLMIAAVTIDQLTKEDVKQAIDNAIEMDELKKTLVVFEKEIASLQRKMGAEQAAMVQQNAARQHELTKTQTELKRLMADLQTTKEQIERDQQTKIVIPEIPADRRETLIDLRTQLELKRQRLAELTKQLKAKQSPLQEAEVSLLPGGSGVNFQPRFVECAADSFVLHSLSPPLSVRRGEAAANPPFIRLMEQVAGQKNLMIVFLIRPDGVDTYRHLKRLCDAQEVLNGKLPVPGYGKLDFSHFNK